MGQLVGQSEGRGEGSTWLGAEEWAQQLEDRGTAGGVEKRKGSNTRGMRRQVGIRGESES